MAFIARPRSKAAGAVGPNGQVVFSSSINLETDYGFTRDADDHSGQFVRRIQQISAFYQRFADELKQ